MAVHQCPRCPLRFSYRTELEYHLREDHEQSQHTAGVREASEPIASPALVLPNGRVTGPMIAAAVSAPAGSPVRLKESNRPHWPYHEVTVDAPVEPAYDHNVEGQPLQKITLTPRRMVVGVIGIVIVIMGLGLLFGS